MKPRLNVSFPTLRQLCYWYGQQYEPQEGEYLLNHARTGIVMALRSALPNGGRVGVVAYNCHTVANAVVNAGCEPIFVDITGELMVDVPSLPKDLDAIVVTNLFGIRNDIAAIRKQCPKAIIIVDNAHGYGLPVEGDFAVYSINQGKFPALGEGGVLCTIGDWKLKIENLYKDLPSYGFVAQVKLFVSMLVKAIAYSRLCYRLVMKIKGLRELKSESIKETITMRKMAPGIRRMYKAWLPNAETEIAKQKRNAEQIGHWISDNGNLMVGENAFMAVVKCEDSEALKKEFAEIGVETETHFKNAIVWAEQFGYKKGTCPKAEELTQKLLMIPTYRAI